MPPAAAELLLFPSALAFIEGIGAMEMMLVAVIGLLLFGGKGLPDMARTFGKIVREFKKASSSVEAEVKRVMNEEPAEERPAQSLRPKPPAPTPLPLAHSGQSPGSATTDSALPSPSPSTSQPPPPAPGAPGPA